MALKKKVGYKCRIAGVIFLLLVGIAAIVAVAVIQKTLKSQEYGLEVKTHTITVSVQISLDAFRIHACFATLT